MTGRILIVDDNRENLSLLESVLTAEGFDVILAENGKDALEKVRLSPPDLIVSDILMPVMDGYTLCRECKSNDLLKSMPFIFYTATYIDAKDEAFALGLGAKRFLSKPQLPSAMIEVIKEDLDENRSSAQARTEPAGDKTEFFREYNEILFKKLEKKIQDLEATNQQLRLLGKELQTSESRLKSITQNIPGSMIYQAIIKPDGERKFTYVSDSVKKLHGITPEEAIADATKIYGRVHEDDIAMLRQAEDQALRTLSTFKTDVRVKDPSGEMRWSSLTSTPALMRNGSVWWDGIETVITERKKEEQKQKEIGEKYRFLAENMNDILWIMDLDLKTTYVTPSIEAVLGFTPEERMKQSVQEQLTPDSLLIALKALDREKILEKRENTDPNRKVSLVLEYYHKNGTTRWLDAIISAIRDEHGVLKAIYGVSRDITEKRQAEKELIERVKELNCLYSIADLIEKSSSLPDLFQSVANQLPSGFVYPEYACAGIFFKDREYKTDNFQETTWKISSTLKVRGEALGSLNVFYLDGIPGTENTAFLTEERNLIKSVAERLGRVIERKQYEEERDNLISELQQAMSEVKMLSGLLPICASCKKIRDDKGSWNQIESYIQDHSEAEFTHGLCPECAEKLYPGFLKGK